jgi:hypothetical protein
MSVPLVLAIIVAVLAVITLFQSKGTSLLGWAVLLLAAIHLYGAL